MSSEHSLPVQEFERQGFTVFRNVLDPDLVAEASNHVDWLLARNPDLRPEQLGTSLLSNDPFWLRLVSDPRLLDIAEKFIGPDIALFASHYISKPPGDGQPVLWHQDGSYWPLEPMEVVSLWLAIDDSTAENGCMRVVPHTQHLDLQEIKERRDVLNVLGSGMHENSFDYSTAVDVILRAGDVSVHHPNIVHGSNPNPSPLRRCGLTIRYIPTSTRIVSEGPWPSAFLLRGHAIDGINDYLARPKFEAANHMPFRGSEAWAEGTDDVQGTIMKMPEPSFSDEERIAMATRCRDCDPVPKVADAGMLFELGDGRRVQVMHNGLRVVAGGYYGQWMTDLIRLCRGHHEGQEERLFHEVVKRLADDATMIELGGFWSYYSLWFKMDRPERRSVVIEPDPAHLAVGQANAALNDIAPRFKAGFAGASFLPAEPFQCEVSGELLLPRYSVRHLMEEEGWPKLNLLHCDIQGAETEVLESCRELFLGGQIDWVFVSTHAHQISGDPLTHQRCLAILREAGATIEAEHDVHESFSGDGLIVARFCPAPPDWVPVQLTTNRASQALFRHLAFDLHETRLENAALRAELELRGNAPAIFPD